MTFNLRNQISLNLVNMQGWKTGRKIVVIESDDWGSVRMPSYNVYEKLLKQGINVDKCHFNRFDSLESEDDLNALFEVLCNFKDKNGNHPIITANCVVANPDFEKIKESRFREYHYELFPETFKKYPHHQKSFELWKDGIDKKIFFPQFHGREHVNIRFWLNRLIENNPVFIKSFDEGVWGLGSNISKGYKINIQAAFDAENFSEIIEHKAIIEDGLRIFQQLFGFKSSSFIANNFTWDSQLNTTLLENGIFYIQGMKYQINPIFDKKKHTMVRHRIGERNNLGQIYLLRNCQFEPSVFTTIDSVDSCLRDIQNAFLWNKPAIITAHRLNFIGSIIPKNRETNLILLKSLLQKISKKWPDVEYLTSEQLGILISNREQ